MPYQVFYFGCMIPSQRLPDSLAAKYFACMIPWQAVQKARDLYFQASDCRLIIFSQPVGNDKCRNFDIALNVH